MTSERAVLFWRTVARHVNVVNDSQVEFCQQSDGLWARDEQKLSGNTQKRYAMIVVAIPMIALVLIESNDFGVSEIVRETSSIPAYREYAEKHR